MMVSRPLAATLVRAFFPAVPVSLRAVPVSLTVSLGLEPMRPPSTTVERPTALAAPVLRPPPCDGAAGFGLRLRNRLRYARYAPLFRAWGKMGAEGRERNGGAD